MYPAPSPIVGHSHPRSSARRRLKRRSKRRTPITFNSVQAQRLCEYIEVWKQASLPAPTHFLTINFSISRKLSHHLATMPASSVRADVFRALGVHYRSHERQWLCVWAMESRHGKHVHALMSVPAADEFQQSLAKLLINATGMEVPPDANAWDWIGRVDTGEPVCVLPISQEESYRGQPAVDGLTWYLAKEIDNKVHSRCRKAHRRRLGRLVGASRLVAALRRDWTIDPFNASASHVR